MSFPAMVHLDSPLLPHPLQSPFWAAWNNVLQRYSKFQLAAWSSLLVYQGSYLLVSLPGFIYQFIPAMKKYKIHPTLFAMHSLYISLGEYIITGTGIFAAVHIFCKHLFMAWVWFAALLLKTMDTHRGYNIPWNPLRYIPFTVGTPFHAFHHSNFHRNYSPAFSRWDKLFGTGKEYKAFLAKKKQKEMQKSD